MSTHVFVNGEDLDRLPGVNKFAPDDRRLGNICFRKGLEGWFFEMPDSTETVPEELAGLVRKISFWGHFPDDPHRERGVYQYGTAKAILTTLPSTVVCEYKVEIRGDNLDDIRELFSKIQAGSIRPVESYEGKQTGQSRADLEAEVKRLRKELEEALLSERAYERMYREGQEVFRKDRDTFCEVRAFAKSLEKTTLWTDGKWPYVRKDAIAAIINKILDERSENGE